MYSPRPPSDGALARPHRQPSTASAADSLAVFALAKFIARPKHRATSPTLVDPQLALALTFAICARFQERSIKDSSCRKLGDDSDAFTIKKVDFSGGDFAGLQTWDDPTPRSSSQYTDEEVLDAFIAACERCTLPWVYKMPMPEHLERLRQQNDCKMLEIPLHSYAKQKNMLPAELEIMEVKERGLFMEGEKVYGHFNFLVKDSDGTPSLFFAEVDPDCKEEKDVYLCCPLEQNDNGSIIKIFSPFVSNYIFLSFFLNICTNFYF